MTTDKKKNLGFFLWYMSYNKFHHVIQWANIHVSAHVLGHTNTALTITYSAYWVTSMLTTEREVILKVPCGVSDHQWRSGVMFLWVFPRFVCSWQRRWVKRLTSPFFTPVGCFLSNGNTWSLSIVPRSHLQILAAQCCQTSHFCLSLFMHLYCLLRTSWNYLKSQGITNHLSFSRSGSLFSGALVLAQKIEVTNSPANRFTLQHITGLQVAVKYHKIQKRTSKIREENDS